jgi:hypothetical protein
MEEFIQKKKKAEKVYFYLRHKKLKKTNLDQVFREFRSGTIAHKNKKELRQSPICLPSFETTPTQKEVVGQMTWMN